MYKILIKHLQFALIDQKSLLCAWRNNKETPLHIAAKHGYLEIVKLLVKKGASIDVRDENLSTPLILAAQYNRNQVAEYLIKKLVEKKDKWCIELFPH